MKGGDFEKWPGSRSDGPIADAASPDAGEGAAGGLFAHVHPELRAAAAFAIEEIAGTRPLSPKRLAAARRLYADRSFEVAADIPVEERHIRGAPGQPPVRLFTVNAAAGRGKPALVHMHGGGFIMGSARSALPALQAMARELDCVIVTIDYRLAPETTYSGSIEDNYAGLFWLHEHARTLGIDRDRIGVMGESAGGGHAALLALTARKRGEVTLACQCLTYPMLDDRTGSTIAVPPPAGQIIWTAQDNRLGWKSFLGMPPGGKHVPAAAVPARVLDLGGLPPTFIGVGTIDLFRAENIVFAQRLGDAGVAVDLHVVPGAFHGFDRFGGASSSLVRDFTGARLDALRRGLRIA